VVATRTKRKAGALDAGPGNLCNNEEPTQLSVRRLIFAGVNVPSASYPTNTTPRAVTSTRVGPPRRKRSATHTHKTPAHRLANASTQEENLQEQSHQTREGVPPSDFPEASAPQDEDVDMDLFGDIKTVGVSSPSPSASIKRHRFPSGLLVTLEDADAFPFANAALSSPPSRSSPHRSVLPPKSKHKPEQVDPGMSLVDALNQANAHNEMQDTLPRKRKRRASVTQGAEEPLQTETAPAGVTIQDPPDPMAQLMQIFVAGMTASGRIDAESLEALRKAARDKSSQVCTSLKVQQLCLNAPALSRILTSRRQLIVP
jgi:hypothetical protein